MNAAHSALNTVTPATVVAPVSHTDQPVSLDTCDETLSVAEAIAVVDTLHADTLAIDPLELTSDRADAAVARCKVQTTTELLLLLARFHADMGDEIGASLLASFAVQFAAHESATV